MDCSLLQTVDNVAHGAPQRYKDIMRNDTWNCSPGKDKISLNMIDSNHTAGHGKELASCQNDGRCVAFELTDAQDEVQRGFKCQCPEGFSGNFCEIAPTLCDILEQPCEHGGTCHDIDDVTLVMNDDKGMGYICFCPWGFSGVDCEEVVIIDDGDAVRFTGDGYALLPVDDANILLTLPSTNSNVTSKEEPLHNDISLTLEISMNRSYDCILYFQPFVNAKGANSMKDFTRTPATGNSSVHVGFVMLLGILSMK